MRPTPPPADEDYRETFGQELPTESIDNEDNQSDPVPEDDQADFDPGINRNTKAELRRLQRIMMRVAEYDEMGSARASAARAWRDLEVLRLAKAGKPVLLTLSGKADVSRKSTSPSLMPDAFQKAA